MQNLKNDISDFYFISFVFFHFCLCHIIKISKANNHFLKNQFWQQLGKTW